MGEQSDLPHCGHLGGAEQRAAPRFTLLIRIAKLEADGQDFLCILRDASTTGAKVRLFSPLPPHTSLGLELANGEWIPVELVWRDGDYAGLRFKQPVAMERLMDESGAGSGRRQVRVRIALDGLLFSGGEGVRVAFQDLSQQGARVECSKWLLMNELVRLETGVTAPLYAKVRWRSHPFYGLVFEQTFRLEELAHLSAPLQKRLAGSADLDDIVDGMEGRQIG